MKKKTVVKIILDIIMIIVLVLLYNKRAISMQFHEVAGLVLGCFFIIHLLLNSKWICNVTKKLFSRTLPIKTRIGYVINTLLLLSFCAIIVSGMFISKSIFNLSYQGAFNFKSLHYGASAVALVLIGIHLGLHYQFISGMFKKMVHIPNKIMKPMGIVITVIIMGYGCYSLVTTSFISWLTMPFTVTQAGIPGGEFKGEAGGPEDELKGKDGMPGNRADFNQGEMPEFSEKIMGNENALNANGIMNALSTIANYFSITFVFAVITGFIDTRFTKLRIKKNKLKA